jgi:hypothetical protein
MPGKRILCESSESITSSPAGGAPGHPGSGWLTALTMNAVGVGGGFCRQISVGGSPPPPPPVCMRMVPVVEPDIPMSEPPGWPTKSIRYVMSKKLSTPRFAGLRVNVVWPARHAETGPAVTRNRSKSGSPGSCPGLSFPGEGLTDRRRAARCRSRTGPAR